MNKHQFLQRALLFEYQKIRYINNNDELQSEINKVLSINKSANKYVVYSKTNLKYNCEVLRIKVSVTSSQLHSISYLVTLMFQWKAPIENGR